MKGTEKIIAHIKADAQAQVDAILAQAEQQCAGIRADYAEKAEKAYTDKIRAGTKLSQDKLDSQMRLSQMEGRKALLGVKQEMVAKSFEKAAVMLTELEGDEYVKLLSRLAAKAAVTGDESVLLNARDKAKGAEVVSAANALLEAEGKNAALSLDEGEGSFAGGLILRRGSIEVNCTVELLIELCRGEMSAKLAGVLFA